MSHGHEIYNIIVKAEENEIENEVFILIWSGLGPVTDCSSRKGRNIYSPVRMVQHFANAKNIYIEFQCFRILFFLSFITCFA